MNPKRSTVAGGAVRYPLGAGVMIVSSLLIAPAACGQTVDAPLSLTERAHIASRLYAAIPLYFAHWEGLPPGFDLDSLYGDYLDRALGAADRRAFTLASMQFMASFRNGHTMFRDLRLEEREGQPFPFDVRYLAGRWVVMSSLHPGLRPGDVISAVDNELVEHVFFRLRRYLAASDERWARLRLFRTPVLFPLSVVLTLADGRRVEVRRELAPPPSARPPSFEARVLEGGSAGYVRLRSFFEAAFEDSAVAFVRRSGSLPALIIDVRGNGGGSTPSKLVRALMNIPSRWFIEATPNQSALARARGELYRAELRWVNRPAPPDDSAYRGRVAILTDGACWSACDDFVVSFRDNSRATVIGDTTGGSSGQPVFVNLPTGFRYQVSAKREYLPDGGPFEGVGIAPHVVVRPTPEDLRAGRDPVLERARSLLLRSSP